MLDLKLFAQLLHHIVVEITGIVSDDFARYPIAVDYLFLDKPGNHLSSDISI